MSSAGWQDDLASAICMAIPGATVTFTEHADDVCPECGHKHTGPELAGICIGCPCNGPGR